MTEWYPITAKFTAEEKKILDILRDQYGVNYNQSLRAGVDLLVRFLLLGEYYVLADKGIMRKVNKVSRKRMKQLDNDVKKILKNIPLEQQEKEYEKVTADTNKIISHMDDIFSKNRKRGRKKLPRKRGRSRI